MQHTVLGLYLSDALTQAMVVEHATSGTIVHAAAEWESSLFSYAGDDTPGVDDFVERLSQFVSANALRVKQVSVALDSSLLFLNTVPFFVTASRADIESQLQWELGEYFPGVPSSNFITDMHVLARMADKNDDNILMVSVQRDLVQKLHRALARLHLSLEVVDVDHFSADTALRFNYPDTANKLIALVGVKDQRLDVSLIRYNEMEKFTYKLTASPNDKAAYIKTMTERTRGLSSISVFGTALTRELLAQLREAISIPVETLNPFRELAIASAVRLHNDPTLQAYRYGAVVGVALRKD